MQLSRNILNGSMSRYTNVCCDARLSTLVADRLWKEQKREQDFQGNVSASTFTSKKRPNMYYVWLFLPFFFSYFYLSLGLRLTVALPSIQVTITCNIACTSTSNWIVHSLEYIYWIKWKLHCSRNVSSINVHDFHFCLKFPVLILTFVFPLTFTWHCWRPGSSLQLPGIYHTLIPPQTRQFIDPSNVTDADLWISDPLKT